MGRILIYCGTRKQCEQISEELGVRHAGVDFYHAGLENDTRHRIQRDFENGAARILVATNAFGMGIDLPDVRLVVHYQMPANLESYYQEIGRAGRDGAPSTCLMLYAKRDKGLHAYFITQSEAEERHRNRRWRALETIVQYAEGGECRHAGILTYFRDSFRLGACGHCDVCAPNSPRRIFRAEIETRDAGFRLKKKGEVPPEKSLNAAALARYEALKIWRRAYAQEQDIPAFLVFSNKTLSDLALKNPRDTAALREIHGLGEKKIETFGSKVLKQLKAMP